MPKEAINLKELLEKIQKGEIKMDKPLIKYQGSDTREFFVFQDSGLNLLLGHEGNGKTKFLTHNIIQLLDQFQDGDPRFLEWKILYVDTERPVSQYAQSVHHIFNAAKMSNSEMFCRLHFLSAMDLECKSIVAAIQEHLHTHREYNFIVIIDHVLPLVYDINSTSEATEIDLFMKRMLVKGHIIIASIHKPYSGIVKGLGHIGSSLQKLSSFTLEISNDDEGNGFEIKQYKARIPKQRNSILCMKLDANGNIDPACLPTIKQTGPRKEKVDETLIVKEILEEFNSQKVKSKKQILLLISKKKNYSESSSSPHTYFNKYLIGQVSFETE